MPLYAESVARSIVYLQKLEKEDPESLLGITLRTQEQLAQCGVECWLGSIRAILLRHFGSPVVPNLGKADVIRVL